MLAVVAGLLLALGVTAVLLDGLSSATVRVVDTAVLLAVTAVVSCGVDGFIGVVGILSFLSLTGVVATSVLDLGDIGFVVDPLLLPLTVASATLLAAGEEGFTEIGFDDADPLLILLTAASSTLLAAGEEGFVDLGDIGFVADSLLSATVSLTSLAAGDKRFFSSWALAGFNSSATAVRVGDLMMVCGLTSLVFVINTGGLISACHVPTNDPHGELGSLGIPLFRWPLSFAIILVVP